MSNPLATAKRIVIKIGSALLVDPATGQAAHTWLDALADDIVAAQVDRKQSICIVSSGAIALGRRVLASNPAVNVFHRGFLACDRYANVQGELTRVDPVLLLGRQAAAVEFSRPDAHWNGRLVG